MMRIRDYFEDVLLIVTEQNRTVHSSLDASATRKASTTDFSTSTSPATGQLTQKSLCEVLLCFIEIWVCVCVFIQTSEKIVYSCFLSDEVQKWISEAFLSLVSVPLYAKVARSKYRKNPEVGS